jgi:hypothetical protein
LNSFLNQLFLRLGSRVKTKLGALGFLLGAVALFTSGANWIEISWAGLSDGITFHEQSTQFTGLESFGYLLPQLLVYFAGLFLVSISNGNLRMFGAVTSFASISSLLLLWTRDVSEENISGVIVSLEQASGISGSALTDSLDIAFLSMTAVSGFVFALMALTSLALVIAGKRLDSRGQDNRKRVSITKTLEKDPISLWDNQG